MHTAHPPDKSPEMCMKSSFDVMRGEHYWTGGKQGQLLFRPFFLILSLLVVNVLIRPGDPMIYMPPALSVLEYVFIQKCSTFCRGMPLPIVLLAIPSLVLACIPTKTPEPGIPATPPPISTLI